MEKAIEIFKKHFKRKSGMDADETTLEYMSYCIDAMVEYADHVKNSEEECEPYFGWCNVEGCNSEAVNGGGCWRNTGYWSVCTKHASEYRAGKSQPPMKQWAIDREKRRGPDGVLVSEENRFSIMTEKDTELLEAYMWGFNDELYGKTRILNPNSLSLRAYNLGRIDALIGDDVSSSDLQSNEEILNRIRRPNVC